MIDDAERMEFTDVEVIGHRDRRLRCRVGRRIVRVAPLLMLPGTTVAQVGDRGTLVLAPEVARALGLG